MPPNAPELPLLSIKLIIPSLPPWQETFCASIVKTSALGSLITKVMLSEHSLSSETVHSYEPGHNPDIAGVVGPYVQLYIYPDETVPPETFTEADPSQSPLQTTSDDVELVMSKRAGSVITTVVSAYKVKPGSYTQIS